MKELKWPKTMLQILGENQERESWLQAQCSTGQISLLVLITGFIDCWPPWLCSFLIVNTDPMQRAVCPAARLDASAAMEGLGFITERLQQELAWHLFLHSEHIFSGRFTGVIPRHIIQCNCTSATHPFLLNAGLRHQTMICEVCQAL